MATQILPETILDRKLEARRKLVKMAVYDHGRRLGDTPKRAFVVSLIAWRLGDIPAELPPAPSHFGLSEAQGAAWTATVEQWLTEATAQIGGNDA